MKVSAKETEMHDEVEIDRLIKSTLRDIFDYIGGINLEHVNDATLRTYLERLIKKAGS